MKTPAELLAAKKKPRQFAVDKRKRVWVCKVRDFRRSLGLTMREMCEALKMAPSGAVHIEHGYDVMLSTARKLAEFFGKEIKELWPDLADKT